MVFSFGRTPKEKKKRKTESDVLFSWIFFLFFGAGGIFGHRDRKSIPVLYIIVWKKDNGAVNYLICAMAQNKKYFEYTHCMARWLDTMRNKINSTIKTNQRYIKQATKTASYLFFTYVLRLLSGEAGLRHGDAHLRHDVTRASAARSGEAVSPSVEEQARYSIGGGPGKTPSDGG